MSQIEIPKGWELKKLYEIAEIGQGGTPSRSKSEYWNGTIPWLRSGELRNNRINDSNEKITDLGLKNSSTKLCPKGTILMAMTGQGLTRGRTALLEIEACANQSCAHIINENKDKLLTEFLWAFLQSKYWFIRSIHHGSGQPGINVSLIKQLEVPIPPIHIQKKIVQKLDYVLSRITEKSKAIFELQKKVDLSGVVRQYRLFILDIAYSGLLTKEWRVKNPEIESAQEFIYNLLKQGEDMSNYTVMKNFDLPPKWIYCKLGLLSELITKGSSPNWQGINYADNGILFITSENVGNGDLRLDNKKYVEKKFNEKQKRSILQKNDLLTNIVGASIGRSAIFNINESANINQAVSLIRLKNGINPKYILNILNSPRTLSFMHVNKVDAARPNLSLKDIANIPIPFPPIEEQNQIIKVISEKIDNSKNIELTLNYASETRKQIKRYLEHLTAGILEQAFSGKLVN